MSEVDEGRCFFSLESGFYIQNKGVEQTVQTMRAEQTSVLHNKCPLDGHHEVRL